MLLLGKGLSPPPPAQAPPSRAVKVSGLGPTELVRMLTQSVCASCLRTSLVVTALTQRNKFTRPQRLRCCKAMGWALPHQLGSLAPASGGALAGWEPREHKPTSLCTAPYHRALHSPCSPALGQSLAPCHAALRPNPTHAEGNVRVGNLARRQSPTTRCRN